MRHRLMFKGLYTAIITPFHNGEVDYDTFTKLIEEQISAGVAGIVPAGTTGESPTLAPDEHLKVIQHSVEVAAGRIQIVAGTGANSTQEAIHLTQEAEKLGIDGSLQVCPYYNKPSQEGLFQHYQAIANATKIPLMLYSVPGRSSIEIGVETSARLAEACKNIVSIKEAGGCVGRVNALKSSLPDEFTIVSGDDPLTLPFMACGATGLVSVASNLIPSEMNQLVQSMLDNDLTTARGIHFDYLELMETLMGIATNPVGIKSAMALAGKCQNEFRLPLCPIEEEKAETIKSLLAKYDLLG